MDTQPESTQPDDTLEPDPCSGSYACRCLECQAERDRLVARGVRPKPRFPQRVSTLQPWERGPHAA